MIPAESTYCIDPACSGRAEPEQDGDHLYYECLTCGFAFGFTRLSAETQPRDVCAAGISEDVRRAASQPMTTVLRASGPPLLSIGRRPDAGDHAQKRSDHH